MSDFVMMAPGKKVLTTDKVGLIDADFLKYLVIHDVGKSIKEKTAYLYEDPAIHFLKERIANITNRFEAKGLIFLFSGPSQKTFRASIAFDKKYKGKRDYTELYEGQEEDKAKVIGYVKNRYPSLIFNDLEADDLVCMLQDKDTFVFSKDKDLKQIPGTHYHIMDEYFYNISNEEGFEFLMRQMIEGDSVDNITGIKGIGPVGINQLLTNQQVKTMHHIVLNKFVEKMGLWNGIDAFCETWNLVRLRNTRGDYFISKYKSAFDLLRMIKNQ